jgi:hypothetical protein
MIPEWISLISYFSGIDTGIFHNPWNFAKPVCKPSHVHEFRPFNLEAPERQTKIKMKKTPLTAEERDRRAVDKNFDFEDLPNKDPVPKRLKFDTLKNYRKVIYKWDA